MGALVLVACASCALARLPLPASDDGQLPDGGVDGGAKLDGSSDAGPPPPSCDVFDEELRVVAELGGDELGRSEGLVVVDPGALELAQRPVRHGAWLATGYDNAELSGDPSFDEIVGLDSSGQAFVSGDELERIKSRDFDALVDRLGIDNGDRFLVTFPELWDPDLPLVFGNELGGLRGWRGDLLYVAVYDRALSVEEIERHSQLGPG